MKMPQIWTTGRNLDRHLFKHKLKRLNLLNESRSLTPPAASSRSSSVWIVGHIALSRQVGMCRKPSPNSK